MSILKDKTSLIIVLAVIVFCVVWYGLVLPPVNQQAREEAQRRQKAAASRREELSRPTAPAKTETAAAATGKTAMTTAAPSLRDTTASVSATEPPAITEASPPEKPAAASWGGRRIAEKEGVARQNGVVTATTAEPHGLVVGDTVRISDVLAEGKRPGEFDGTFRITRVPSASTFCWAQEGRPDGRGGGGSVVQLTPVETDKFRLEFTEVGGAVAQVVVRNEWLSAQARQAAAKPEAERTAAERELVREQPLVLLDELEKQHYSGVVCALHVDTVEHQVEAVRFQRTRLDAAWSGEGDQARRVVEYRFLRPGHYHLLKRYTLYKNLWHLRLEVEVTNLQEKRALYTWRVRGPAGILPDIPPKGARPYTFTTLNAIAALDTGKGTSLQWSVPDKVRPDQQDLEGAAREAKIDAAKQTWTNVAWVGLQNRYFLTAVAPLEAGVRHVGVIRFLEPDPKLRALDQRFTFANASAEIGAEAELGGQGAADSSLTRAYALILAPARHQVLANYQEHIEGYPPDRPPLELDQVVGYYSGCFLAAWTAPLTRLMLVLFVFIHSVIGSWGIAVILLTAVVKLCLYPLQKKMTVSMHNFQKIQPLILALKEKYKNDKSPEAQRKMQLEQMNLMREHRANPAMSCLPMFIQLPIFIALYGAFSTSFELRQAPFLYVQDLAEPDRLFPLDVQDKIWLVPQYFNLLPVLYLGLMLYQVLKMPRPADEQQKMQWQMQLLMPILFSFIFWAMPAGLVLYFVASSLFGLVETWYVKKRFCAPAPAAGADATRLAASPGTPQGTAPKPKREPSPWAQMLTGGKKDKKAKKKGR